MKRRIALFVIAASVIGLSSLALAQQFRGEHKAGEHKAGEHKAGEHKAGEHKGMKHALSATGQTPEYPPGTIDGSKNPELISDSKAYEVFFHSVAVSERDSEVAKANSKSKFARAKLDDKDTAILMSILGEFHQGREQLNARLNQLRKGNASKDRLIELDAQANNLVSLAQQKVNGQLSKEGGSKLREHIMDLKTKIKILPPAK